MRRTSPITRAIVSVAACLAVTVLVSARQAPRLGRPFRLAVHGPKRNRRPSASTRRSWPMPSRSLLPTRIETPGSCRRDPERFPQRGALQRPHRSNRSAGGIERDHHPSRQGRGGVGRYGARRHDLQRHEDLSLDRRRARVRPREDQDVTDRVAGYMPKGVDLFASPHNAPITWEHLLRQTSDWSGTLWSKPDWADRPPRGQTPDQWEKREMHEPGTFFNLTTRGSTCSRSRRSTSSSNRCPSSEGVDHGSHRCVRHLALGGLRQRMGRDQRQEDEVGHRRRALRWRDVHQRLGHGAIRVSVPSQRQMGRPAARFREVDRHGEAPGPANDVRLSQLVPEPSGPAPDGTAGPCRSRPHRAGRSLSRATA